MRVPVALTVRQDRDGSRLPAPAALTVRQDPDKSRSAALASTNMAIVLSAALFAAQVIVLLVTSL
jgi:hypothetical protein